MAGQTVVISVLADTKKFASDFKDAGDKAGGLSNGFKAAAVGIGIAAVAVGGFLVASIKAAGEAEKIAAQTAAALASTGSAAGRTADQISGLAGGLSKLSGIDDEVIQSGQNLLLTFTNIKGVNFDKATQAALDLSVAMGTDMTSASTLVGKALNDPIKGISALSRVGVQLSDSQKATIKSMVELGDTAGAQAVILGELQTQFGGSAEAFGNTYEGAIGKVKTAFGNLQENIGAAFLPGLTLVINKGAELLNALGENPAFVALTEKVGDFVSALFSGQSGLGDFAAKFLPLLGFLSPFGVLLKVIQPLLPEIGKAFQQIGGALASALLPILPKLTALLNQMVGILSGALAQILPVLVSVFLKLASVLGSILGAVLPILVSIIGTLISVLEPIINAILPPLLTLFTFLAEIIETFVVPIITKLAEFIGKVVEALAPLLVAVGELVGQLLDALMPILEALLPPILAVVSALLDFLIPVITAVIQVIVAVVTAIVDFISWVVSLGSKSTEVGEMIASVGQSVLDFFGSIPDSIASVFTGAVEWLKQAGVDVVQGLINGVTGMVSKAVKAITDLGDSIADGLKDALGIASPSKVFKVLGRYTVQGLEAGLNDPNRLDSIMSGLSDQVTGGFTASLDTPSGYLSSGGGGAVVTVNFNGLVTDPVAAGREVKRVLSEYQRGGGQL